MDPAVVRSAVACTARLMAISAPFCEFHLPLLFSFLERTRSPDLRASVAVALGDLSSRHPNLIEPWTDRIYRGLRDDDDSVRRTTLMVLTHLILNDMVKVRGQIGEVACCLEDPVPAIRDLARTFFTELAKRHSSPVYNLMPDILSTVATHPQVSPSSFRAIMRFLLAFIAKDKHVEALTEKLAHRLASTSDPALWKGFAYCIAQLPHSAKSVARLGEAIPAMQAALGDAAVFKHITAAIAKAPKPTTPEQRQRAEEIAAKLAKAHSEQAEADGLAAGAARTTARRAARPAKAAALKDSTRAARPPRPARKRAVESDDDSDDGSASASETI